MNALLKQQMDNTLQRMKDRETIRNQHLRMIAEHRYFDIDSPARVKKFLTRRGVSSLDTREILNTPKGMPELIQPLRTNDEIISLERIMGTNDLVGVSFLREALGISNSVGRIWICSSAGNVVGYGTGFMVSPRLALTNHHVLPDAGVARFAKIEFGYELDGDSNLLPSDIFTFEPDTFYLSDEGLDFALVAVSPVNTARKEVDAIGWNRLLREEGKTIISQWLNIIQHPNGMPKQLGIRENQLIDVLDNFIHYKTDTAPGSSGSPVYNERWEVVGLHHSSVYAKDDDGHILTQAGGKWDASMSDDKIKWIANEGIRVSTILKFLDNQRFTKEQAKLYDELLTAKPTTKPQAPSPRPATESTPVATLQPDGHMTVTLPLTISFKLGGDALPILVNATPVVKTDDLGSTVNDDVGPAAALIKAKQALQGREDVLNVRMGYVFRNGWITRERAIVVTVPQKKSIAELKTENTSPLPDTFMGYPVEVTGPTFMDLIALHRGDDTAERLVHAFEVQAQEIKYFPPAGVKLKTVKEKMKVTAHVSPEEGWKNLSPFFSNVKKTLTVGMYDFGAPHILKRVEHVTVQSTFRKFTLALQSGESVGEGTKADDLKDADVVDELKKKLKSKFQNAWVKIGSVNGWVSSSYHIKVAVKDSKAFWLSSGNWQSSNQPNIPKLTNKTQAYLLKTYNREWHAIVEHPGLSKTYEEFILNDFNNNKAPAVTEAFAENLNFLLPEVTFGEEASTVPYQAFKPFEEDRPFKVTPLLTPDNFYDEVIKLVKSAKHELLIQNQTFNAPKDGQDKLKGLIQAVLDKQKAGVNVKIIFRVVIASVARENLEKLVDMGFDATAIKLQVNCHTKGVIVDGKTVMLGSQNWSNDGVSVNRDASLLFYDKELAQYFRKIFLHDWTMLAKQSIGHETVSPTLAESTEVIPTGMRLFTWSEIREML
ncbi:phospholipase D-like domain-containing protein [Chryseolinea lacunae]|uniref:Serine protease n=1 Tax=Chryseolinea lacunae TaxID=2801331 RepID=A0ABS1KZJ8_9BACT|nr:phospholipase D-like domain-containing protein [Chryseolinea lacunae]MBL0744770.1 trypsin-like peptidase domain-containing protein [Chryseolinea lacunae]